MRDTLPRISGFRSFIQSPGRYLYNKLHQRYFGRNFQHRADESYIADGDKFLERLVKEWAEHGKIIIAIDIDDTVLPFRTAIQDECDKVINIVKDCQLVGAYVIIYSCRDEAGLEGAVGYLKSKGLTVDAINKNPIKLPYGNSAKPYANIFLDDRAGLKLALNMLLEAMYRQRARNWSSRLNYPGAGG